MHKTPRFPVMWRKGRGVNKADPDLFAGLPDHAPEATSRIAQGHHEQPRAPVSTGLRIAGQRAFAVVDRGLLAGGELEAVELLGIDVTQGAHESLDALVARGEAKLIDQILIDRLAVALQANLLLDSVTMRFAC